MKVNFAAVSPPNSCCHGGPRKSLSILVWASAAELSDALWHTADRRRSQRGPTLAKRSTSSAWRPGRWNDGIHRLTASRTGKLLMLVDLACRTRSGRSPRHGAPAAKRSRRARASVASGAPRTCTLHLSTREVLQPAAPRACAAGLASHRTLSTHLPGGPSWVAPPSARRTGSGSNPAVADLVAWLHL